MENNNKRLAVLIDADNAQASISAELLSEIAKFGIASVKRAYGDWTTTNLKGWKDHLHKHAIQPIQQFSYTTGKNATDSSLIIDAMDLLHQDKLDGFCIVSSDSDFTRLATRIREAGLIVYGFGELKTPQPFISACDKFVFTEILRKDNNIEDNTSEETTPIRSMISSAMSVLSRKNKTSEDSTSEEDTPIETIINTAINALSKDDGWAPLSGVGGYINKNNPSFDPRNYGFEKLGKLVKSLNYVEFQHRKFNDGSDNTHIYIKLKNA